MQITFLGGVRTVTGSSFLLEHDSTRFLIDCGMFQGGKELEKRNRSFDRFDPKAIQYVLLTHAHIDHSGLIPKLVKEGFRGKIICTRATYELCRIMLPDSAHIQEMEAEWKSRKNIRSGLKPVEPLYTIKDAERSLDFFQPLEPNQCFRLCPEVEICFYKAGHILGASILELDFEEQGRKGTAVFSGDVGRREALIVPEPDLREKADFLFVESTYGNRNHKGFEESKAELLAAIREGIQNGEKIIIPAFAVERTQEILYLLHEFRKKDLYPPIPVFLDSPLAIAATEVFKKLPEYVDEEMGRLLGNGENPLALEDLRYCRTAEESMAINRYQGPAIVIAASGMCNAGRILHHLKHNLWRPGAQIVITGFQAQGTLGRAIVDGAKKVRIFKEEVAVRARIHTINGFSAHADQQELLAWIGNFKNPEMEIFLIHGEESISLAFAQVLKEKLPFRVRVPQWGETLTLTPPHIGEAPLAEEEDLEALWKALERHFQASLRRAVKDTHRLSALKEWLKKTEEGLGEILD